jgi:hypothetical protein
MVAAGKAMATTPEMEMAEKGIMVDIKKVFYGTWNISHDVEVKKSTKFTLTPTQNPTKKILT